MLNSVNQYFEKITSQKGKDQIVYEGYIYTFNKKYKTSTKYICSKSKALLCRASLSMDPDLNTILKVNNVHNHEPLQNTIQIKKFREQWKPKLKSSHHKTSPNIFTLP